jgi:thiol-disulfide isomerase/thioredoxin
MAVPLRYRHLRKFAGVALLASIAPLTLVRGQVEPKAAPAALGILERAARQYSGLTSYEITRQEFFASSGPVPTPPPSTVTAIEAPGGRYRFEGDKGWGKVVLVCDGRWVWYYRPRQNAYTRRPATGKKPELPAVPGPDDANIEEAANLHDMAWLGRDFKSARLLPGGLLTLRGKSFECYLVQVTNDDRKVPLPYPFTYWIWIQKGSFKIREIIESYTATLRRLSQPPVTFPMTTTSLYPEMVLNQPIPDAEFQFTPPASARLVRQFSDQVVRLPRSNTTGTKLSDVVFTARDGSKLPLESLRGHPVLIDLWATWCAPCLDAFPHLAKLYRETRSIGLVILSVDIADNAYVAQSYIKKMHYPWRNFHGYSAIISAFGPSGVPRAILINADGESVFDKVGPALDELRAAIGKLASGHAKSVRK